LINYDGLLCY